MGEGIIHSEDFEYDISVEQTNFTQNSATYEGGDIKWTFYSPTETNNQYSLTLLPTDKIEHLIHPRYLLQGRGPDLD